jgi:hypothetical protein
MVRDWQLNHDKNSFMKLADAYWKWLFHNTRRKFGMYPSAYFTIGYIHANNVTLKRINDGPDADVTDSNGS